MPSPHEVPEDLHHWWENQLIEAGRRAFDSKRLRTRYHRGDYNDGVPPGDGVVWSSAVCSYRGREILVELSRVLQDGPWFASAAIYCERTFSLEGRLFFPDIAATPAGAAGAYALIIGQIKDEIDCIDAPLGV
ncbi:hypothetical protein QLQ15_09310 [Lysobacter sp. LF1]|uniref:DUF2591 domain-containing protein n=1 Tax=Lysobacter stagni TaxID=3045172 RepID=A0ABT6XG24_9GAMM|nr:hypothetical protein [Lysobacter sp. LF1]MDI9239106.1 hypothetical protein [Lysobacter sp. LF1]